MRADLIERLREGVKSVPTNEFETDLYDIDDAETAMAQAADAIARLQAEIARLREATLREAAEIVRCRADFSMPEGIGPKPPWHRFAYECAYTLEQIAALGGSNDKG